LRGSQAPEGAEEGAIEHRTGEWSLARQPVERAPRLEALLDERDHIRIKLSLVDDQDAHGEAFDLRQRLLKLDKKSCRTGTAPVRTIREHRQFR
jgi:hypothetical protein